MRRATWLVVAPLLLLGGCGSGAERTTITVFAAASLEHPFTEIGEAFEAEHPDVDVRFSFAGSSDLVAQAEQGAPADVLATADVATMEDASGAGLIHGDSKVFATNRLEIVTPPGNPAGVDSVDDLDAPGIKVVVCAPQVPCGSAASQVADAAGLTLRPVSEEQSVTDVLGKVVSGEADAGLVYVTDARAAGDDVDRVPFPEAGDVVNRYPIAAAEQGEHRDDAVAFVEFVLGSEAQATLSAAGFGRP